MKYVWNRSKERGKRKRARRKEVYEEFHKNRWNMHSTAERGEASRRRWTSPGKLESQRKGRKRSRGNLAEKERGGLEWRGKRERMKAEWVVGGYLKEKGGVGQIKERNVRERTFGTSSRTKSNFALTTKLSYFPRNMHARGRAQVFQQRFPASYLWRLALSYKKEILSCESRPVRACIFAKWQIKFPLS